VVIRLQPEVVFSVYTNQGSLKFIWMMELHFLQYFDVAMCAAQAHISRVSTVTEGRKTTRLVARVSQRDKNLLQRAAALEGRSLATFVVSHALADAKRLVSEPDVIRLTARESRKFVEALLASPRKPAAATRRAMTEYRRRVVNHL
jgi:uncharacterized protein (DUF1778 family)